jgi:hypothetical protein
MATADEAAAQLRRVMAVIKDDPTGTGLVLDVVRRAGEYVAAVNLLEAELMRPGEGEEYRRRVGDLDRRRSQCHDALIDAVNISCRYLAKSYPGELPPGGLYPDPDHLIGRNRRVIGDWAGALVSGLFSGRR